MCPNLHCNINFLLSISTVTGVIKSSTVNVCSLTVEGEEHISQ